MVVWAWGALQLVSGNRIVGSLAIVSSGMVIALLVGLWSGERECGFAGIVEIIAEVLGNH
jgi:hypothetical protein